MNRLPFPAEANALPDGAPLPLDVSVDALGDDDVGQLELDEEPVAVDTLPDRRGELLVRSDHFDTLGLTHHELRLNVIRDAAERLSQRAADQHRDEPSAEHEAELVRLAVSTYRVLDPRARLSRFQSAHIGRILPNALQYASRTGFAEPSRLSPPASLASRRNALCALIDPPTAISAIAAAASVTADPDRESPTLAVPPRVTVSPRVPAPTISAGRREAHEALHELRSLSRINRTWTEFAHMPATLISLTVLALIAALGLGVWTRQLGRTPTALAATARTAVANIDPAVAPESVAVLQEPLSAPEPPRDVSIESPGDELASPDAPPVTELPKDESVLMLATDQTPAEPLASAKMAEADPAPTVDQPTLLEPTPAVASMAESTIPTPSPILSSLAAERAAAEALGPGELIAAMTQRWNETDDAARRFTLTAAADLASEWDLVGELAGFGTLDHAAAESLALEASWLVEPFPETVARARQLAVAINPADAAATTNADKPAMVSQSVAELLVRSWQSGRARVDRTEDLTALVRGANQLIDAMLCSQQTDVLPPLMADLAKTVPFLVDQTTIKHTGELTAAVASANPVSPGASEVLTGGARAVRGRVLCLQCRAWEDGLQLLAESSDPFLRGIARAELAAWDRAWSDATMTPDQLRVELCEIASRWSKAASKYPSREAASIRLHALDLIAETPEEVRAGLVDVVELEQSLRAALPDYVRYSDR